ncbi:MAG: class I SAM-dependent methyltransferase [Abitibacteriaceae bacterium]|nr:class I SAM-dependent methyltransferase [Abditibacteriaceae bacterium]
MRASRAGLENNSAVLPPDRQAAANRLVYDAPHVYRDYLSVYLEPAEVSCLLKYQPYFCGHDVLDIGVGAGRTTRYLAPLAGRYEAVDYSPVMVAYMQNTMPEVSVRQADFRALNAFRDQSFDFLFATDNVIDTLSHEDRLCALSEAFRVLRPGGILAFSSHNAHYKPAYAGPRLEWSRNPVTLAANVAQLLLRWRNHLRVGPLRQITPEYALLNDIGHHYACLHYYVTRAIMQSQLASVGLRLIEVFNVHGEVMQDNDDDSQSPSLFYVTEHL